jgi:energy-converting hydrogenase Eha subunit B
VSIAFGIFSVNVIISKLDVFGLEIADTILDMVFAILTFAALALFFMAIVRRERLKPNHN